MKYVKGQAITPLIVTNREKKIWGMYEGMPMYVISCNNVEVKVELQGRHVVYPISQVKPLENVPNKELEECQVNIPIKELEKLKTLKL